jgi:hypothetical protein
MRWYHYISYFFGGAFLERRYRASVPEPVRDAARGRIVAGVGQRLVGRGQLRVRLLAACTGREFRIPLLAPCAGRWRRWSGDGVHARARLWTLPWRSVTSLANEAPAEPLLGAPVGAGRLEARTLTRLDEAVVALRQAEAELANRLPASYPGEGICHAIEVAPVGALADAPADRRRQSPCVAFLDLVGSNLFCLSED